MKEEKKFADKDEELVDQLSGEHRLVEDYLGERARVYGIERAILVDLYTSHYSERDRRERLTELEALAETAGIPTLAVITQQRDRIDPACFIGRGKVEEIKAAAVTLNADVIIFNDPLSPAQARNLEEKIGLKIIDRPQLIMDIFAQRATTKEAQLQVELAQLEYLRTRLRGWGKALTRLGGGIGTRGPGETKLETDRQKIADRLHLIKQKLLKVKRERELRGKLRRSSTLPQITLVGYTNSGKSTLLNVLCGDEHSFVEDKLFATLETMVRRAALADGRPVLFIDTVGFIRDLPPSLIPAFAATLEAVRNADLLLHILDGANPSCSDQHAAVMKILDEEIFTDEEQRPPMITVINKIDLLPVNSLPCSSLFANSVSISAAQKINLESLHNKIALLLTQGESEMNLLFPFRCLGVLEQMHRAGRVLNQHYEQEGVKARVRVKESTLASLRSAGVILLGI
ncbi:GTPase HflX [Candidatus Acetothermia bacterium]|nr:GTPase HflX [Candidatus Acetothermia bacterium]